MASVAPVMPLAITSTAVNEGRPPTFSATAIATGAVTPRGAMVAINSAGAPHRRTTAIADNAPTMLPTISVKAAGASEALTSFHWRRSGIASATVAVPSRKCTNCAPSK